MTPLADKILRQLGLQDSKLAIDYKVIPLSRSLLTRRAIQQAAEDKPVFAASSKSTAHWLAATRPTEFIHKQHDRFLLEIDDLQLQRAVVALLSYSLKDIYGGQPLGPAIHSAWNQLFAHGGVRETVDEQARDVARRPHVIARRQAVGHWVGVGLTSGLLTASVAKPRHTTAMSCWLDRSQEFAWVPRLAIQTILQHYHYAAWDFTELFAGRGGEPLLCNTRMVGKHFMVQLPVSILSEQAKQVFRAGSRRPTAQNGDQKIDVA